MRTETERQFRFLQMNGRKFVLVEGQIDFFRQFTESVERGDESEEYVQSTTARAISSGHSLLASMPSSYHILMPAS